MKYQKQIVLKNQQACLIRSACESDAEAVLACLKATHGQTDFLLSYPEESGFDLEQERQYLAEKERSEREIQLCAIVDGRLVGLADVSEVGRYERVRHRAELGICIEKAFWGLGIGRAMVELCVECARAAGYAQLELHCVRENQRAIKLYESVGFRECGSNPRGCRSRVTGWQEVVFMVLTLDWTRTERKLR